MQLYIATEARKAEVPESLVAALVQVESAGDQLQIRMEPGYLWLWNVEADKPYRPLAYLAEEQNAPPDFPGSIHSADTEWIGQHISWGPMQVMGATARWLGFKGPFPQLCGVTGLHYGVSYLVYLRDLYLPAHGWEGVVAAYNAGSPTLAKNSGEYRNQWYVERVRRAGGFDFQPTGD